MKTFRTIGMAVLAVLMCVSFTACSDEDEGNGGHPLVGAWTRLLGDGHSEIYEFKSNGTFRKFVLFEETKEGIFSINEELKTLTLSYSSGDTYAYYLTTLTDSYFVIMSMKSLSSYTYNRREVDPEGDYDPLTTEMVDGHEVVDLGLSVRWATCNVGATSWEKEGGNFAWGETSTKAEYNKDNYKWGDPTYDRWGNINGLSFFKYCTDSNYGKVDNKTTLEAYDDVATVKWGKKWRMPTKEECEELQTKCSQVSATRNGVNGVYYLASNGNYIFLPNTGYYVDYWTSSLSDYSDDEAYYYYGQSCNTRSRYEGRSVRPVCK